MPTIPAITNHYDDSIDGTIPKQLSDIGDDDMDEIPNNVSSVEQLKLLPSDCLNKDATTSVHRPLLHVDDRGHIYTYMTQPKYIILLILVVEMIERFSYYGVYYTQTLYLTGVYNEEWNAQYTSIEAASFVSLSTAVAYTTPFIGAYLSDIVFGDYTAIVIGSVCLYLPGLLLVALTSVPYLLGSTFNRTALSVAVLGLWPLGTGIVKSVVNVFGARQYHPLLQSSFIESYYVNFYTSINVGSLIGISLLPIIAQHHVTTAYMIPVVLLSLGVVAFLAGTKQYVISPPRGDICSIFTSNHPPATSVTGPITNTNTIPLTTILRISLLIVPFCIAYSQMPTTFIIQGAVMNKAMYGFVDAASINIIDNISVLTFGSIMSSYVYPYLVQQNYKLSTTYKFAIGSFFGLLSLLWALYVEYKIRSTYRNHNGQQISILWQTPSYILIGIGEIFAVSAAYEAAFVASSPATKALASAINIFCVGGLPNLFCIFLYKYCAHWFRNTRDGSTNLTHVSDYVTAQIDRYFTVLVVILMIGIVLNVLPSVRKFVDSTEQRAMDIVKTPLISKFSKQQAQVDLESTPLLRRKFERPLMKMGSMRAGPSFKHLSMSNINQLSTVSGNKNVSTTGQQQAVSLLTGSAKSGKLPVGTIGLTKSIIHRLYHHQDKQPNYHSVVQRNNETVDDAEPTNSKKHIDRQETH